MLIGICGGICAGKTSVLDYLVQRHKFTVLSVRSANSGSNDDSNPATGTDRTSPSQILPSPQPAKHKSTEFATIDDLLTHATAHWGTSFVTTSITSAHDVEILSRRPFFILLHIDAPLSIRWRRRVAQTAALGHPSPSLSDFVHLNDAQIYASAGGTATLAARAQIKLLNLSASLEVLWTALDALNLPDPSRLRPSWDHYFMMLASLAARRSNCMRRQVGCVLVRERRVMATGYNGTPRNVTNCSEGGCPRCNGQGPTALAGGADLSTCLCLHAEENALLEAGRERVGDGAVLYCNTCPCLTCSIKIVQVGITEVVYSQSYYMDAATARIFQEAGVKLRQFSPPAEGLVCLMPEEGKV